MKRETKGWKGREKVDRSYVFLIFIVCYNLSAPYEIMFIIWAHYIRKFRRPSKSRYITYPKYNNKHGFYYNGKVDFLIYLWLENNIIYRTKKKGMPEIILVFTSQNSIYVDWISENSGLSILSSIP